PRRAETDLRRQSARQGRSRQDAELMPMALAPSGPRLARASRLGICAISKTWMVGTSPTMRTRGVIAETPKELPRRERLARGASFHGILSCRKLRTRPGDNH